VRERDERSTHFPQHNRCKGGGLASNFKANIEKITDCPTCRWVGYFFMFLTISITNRIISTISKLNVNVIIMASKTVTASPPFGVIRVKFYPPFKEASPET